MAEHISLGKEGEQIAAAHLEKSGYEILELNWKHGRKEIDIIARKENIIAIIEVKTRTTDYFGTPEEAVTLSKQKYLILAADAFVNELDSEVDVRYDIVSIIKQRDNICVKHIEDAFVPLLE